MATSLDNLVNWIIDDLRVESQIDLEDIELMRLGFSWSETQALSMFQRRNYLEAGGIMEDWKKILERRRELDIAVVSSGFSDKETNGRIIRGWSKELDSNVDRLADFSLMSTRELTAGAPVARSRKRKFLDVLKGLKKDERIDPRSEESETVPTTRQE